MSVKQISVFLENKPGTLSDLTKVLAENDIDMRALYLVETNDFGIARIIVEDVYNTTTILKDAGYINRLTKVILVALPDETGGLNKVLEIFKEQAINVEYMYAILGGRGADDAYMIFRVDDVKKAESALRTKGIRMIDEEGVSAL